MKTYPQPPDVMPVQVNINGHIQTQYQVIDRGTTGGINYFPFAPRVQKLTLPKLPHEWTEGIL